MDTKEAPTSYGGGVSFARARCSLRRMAGVAVGTSGWHGHLLTNRYTTYPSIRSALGQ